MKNKTYCIACQFEKGGQSTSAIHTCVEETNQPSWLEKFDKKFGSFITLGLHNSVIEHRNLVHLNSRNDILDFIRQTIKQERASAVDEERDK